MREENGRRGREDKRIGKDRGKRFEQKKTGGMKRQRVDRTGKARGGGGEHEKIEEKSRGRKRT